MTNQPKPQTDLTVTATEGGVKIVAPPVKAGQQHRPGMNVFVTPDFINEPIEGFVGFLKEYAVVGLAVGFAVGSQAQLVVKQILATFIDPLFQLLFGKALSTRIFTLHFRSHAANFGWGALTYSVLDFVFVLAAIYVIIKFFKLDKLKKETEQEAKKKKKAKQEA